LRENTERPEAIESGVAQLVGKKSLAKMLKENYNDETWLKSVSRIKNPFGDGTSARQIVEILKSQIFVPASKREVNPQTPT
jgi:UDP-N-acetylglucosamine 2-epimerase (non-hydrolysing)